MIKALKKQKNLFLIIILTLIGVAFHFYNLNWGAPFYFHPDERNIASAVSQLQFPHQMNPHFFAYGSLPIYAVYFAGVLTNYVSQLLQISSSQQPFTITFEQAILIGRIFSAFFSTLLIPILYILGTKLKNEKTGLFAAFFATMSVGFIQFAHFGTFEMWLTFFGILLFWKSQEYLQKSSVPLLIYIALLFGIFISIKVTSIALLPILVIVFIEKRLRPYKNKSEQAKKVSHYLLYALADILVFVCLASLVYLITNPYVFLDQKDFLSSMRYESGVALGTEPVFYTDIFNNTFPGFYQLLHVYPFLLNPLLVILFIPAFIYILIELFRRKDNRYLLLIFFFLILFCSQVLLFVKWTRYMVPTLPFIYLIISIALSTVFARKNDEAISKSFGWPRSLRSLAMTCIVLVCIIFAFSYFKTAFINTDSRIDAVTFAQHTISENATILSEPADLGLVPFQDAFSHIDTFNFYELDQHSMDATEQQLQHDIATSDYIILPSQRILQSRLQDPQLFPKGYIFYSSLLNGHLGFRKIYETPCDIFCKITYLGDPVYWWEQTASVFDRPTVFIFKKINYGENNIPNS